MCSPSPKEESVEVEEPGVCSSSSDRPLTLHASYSVSELKQQRRERKPQNAQTPADISQQNSAEASKASGPVTVWDTARGGAGLVPGVSPLLQSHGWQRGGERAGRLGGAVAHCEVCRWENQINNVIFRRFFFFAPIRMRRPSDSLCGSDAVLLFTEATAYLS